MAPPQSGYSSTEIWIDLEFGNVGFWGEEKTRVPGEKPLGAEKRTNNKLNPHIASSHIAGRWVLSPLRHPCSQPKNSNDLKIEKRAKMGGTKPDPIQPP